MSVLSLDEELIEEVEAGAGWRLRVWEPERVVVVLGRGNAVETEIRADACREDGVPVLRRRGGGGAVVLAPGCLVVSLAKTVGQELSAKGYLEAVARILADALRPVTGVAVEVRGTGDLCHGDRKLVGSSLFRRRKLVFYQGSVLVSMDLSLVDRYLRHPTREPAYRGGRPHAEFLTTLRQVGADLPVAQLAPGLWREIAARVEEIR